MFTMFKILYSRLLFLYILSISIITAQDISKNIYDNIAKTKQLSVLGVTLNLVPKFIETLSSAGPYTFFAPNNDAIKNFTLNEIEQILNHQLIFGKLLSDSFKSVTYPKTMHIGPNDMEQPIVVKGSRIMSGWKSANIILPDQVASNGVIHIIDEVLGLPMNPIDTLSQNKFLSKFVNLLKNPKYGKISDEITKICDVGGGVTILAPINKAVLNAPKEIFSNDELVNSILSYHIIPKQILYTGLLLDNVVTAKTLNGEQLIFTKDGNDIYVGNVNIRAKIIMPDILAYDGVIHVIDTVLLPLSIPTTEIFPLPPSTPTTSTSISPTSSPSQNPTPNIGGIIGSALGGFVCGGILMLGSFFLYRYYIIKKRRIERLIPYHYSPSGSDVSNNSRDLPLLPPAAITR